MTTEKQSLVSCKTAVAQHWLKGKFKNEEKAHSTVSFRERPILGRKCFASKAILIVKILTN